MSRVAKSPITVPKGVEVNIQGSEVSVKGPKGNLSVQLHPAVQLKQEEGEYKIAWDSEKDIAMAGTFRALVNNMVTGVSEGFTKKLQLIGVGYRAQAEGGTLNMALGFSHPINFVHDSILMESPEDGAAEAAEELSTIMVETGARWMPDVPSRASGVLMRQWSKKAKPVRVGGRLQVWEAA